jgi:hypothetical protein
MAKDKACEKVAAGMALAVQKGRGAAPTAVSRRQLWVSGAP